MTTIVLAVRQGCLIACCFLPVSPLFAQDDQPQWRQLPLITDGKIDPTWKHLWGGGFSVMDDGSLRTDCTDAGMGLLLYQKQRLGNCRIRVVFRSEKAQSNAGVYVRIDDGVLERADDPLPLRERIDDGRLTKQTLARIEASSDAELEAWYPVHHGYEVQIYDAGDAYHRTGALYSLAPAAEIPEPRGDPWRTMIITLEGNRILVEVDGKQVTKFDPDSRDIPPRKHWSEPRREHTRPPAGFIGLQNHDPGDVVYFKAVSVAPLRRPSSENGSDINSSGDNAASAARPFDGLTFHGRIAYSADGNHNDPDDWASSPVALAILAQAGLKDRLVHFDYNCILTDNDSRWAQTHADSVLGAVQQYGYDRSLFHDCQKDRDAAIDSIARAIDASSAGDTLYFIVAGPMELPFLGIQKSRPDKRQFVGCISHSRWNDGFAKDYTFTHTKRNIIATGVKWIQIPDQNPTLACSKYGQPARSEEFQPFFWMRDSDDARLKFLWERLVVSTRPDCSDAGMAWFLATGDDVCDVEELRRLLEDGQLPAPIGARQHIRLEAECFLNLDGYELEYRDDRQASHRLNVKLSGRTNGQIRTPFLEPYTATSGRYDVDVRFLDDTRQPYWMALHVNGSRQGQRWKSAARGNGWMTETIQDVPIRPGDEIAVRVEAADGSAARIDYVQLDYRGPASTTASDATAPLDDRDALPGQIIVAGKNPGYLKYNGGGPAFLCGPDNRRHIRIAVARHDRRRRGSSTR